MISPKRLQEYTRYWLGSTAGPTVSLEWWRCERSRLGSSDTGRKPLEELRLEFSQLVEGAPAAGQRIG